MNRSIDDLAIISCLSGRNFANSLDHGLRSLMGRTPRGNDGFIMPSEEIWFPGDDGRGLGEVKTVIDDNIRGMHAVVVQDTANYFTNYVDGDGVETNLSQSDRYESLRSAIRAARESAAELVTVVIPYFPSSRQEKRTNHKQKGKLREAIMAKKVARDLERDGANKVITLDIHNEAIEGFFDRTEMINVYAASDFIPYIAENFDLSNAAIGGPDAGSGPRCMFYADILGIDVALAYKRKDYSGAGGVDEIKILGDVEDKTVFIVDDMIARGGSIEEIVKGMKEAGAKDCYFITSLPLLVGPAKQRIEKLFADGFLKGVMVTDGVYHSDYFDKNKNIYHMVPVSCTFSKAIQRLHVDGSVSDLFKPQTILEQIEPYMKR
ncbi:ribose-phosphate pyrophosphokinase [Candidatus Woesearchaeota archaeon]|jgi:ribose-phosphate pyrophosphokinase|nr:ribose-phosphate pyrophosphokinase [Candidatus Woesearchaeota archaeon]MBT5272246.1 ribose-phosphate pyrophosphokinase [Candidatus Woesearchaeota archaeon]MBT6041161.1 ribose-phosphate pyrophosphokinase [Candidatus Woesearchaeota archaeon]MBT6336518.1 ribose-phosphate pyrophosphokinase [Candidatus Woesearchaeota archaeon]MBT7927408.1 ribose-phosphate pyrophosphokinase [Candidatus Woesearchaeota archaeon]